MCKNKGENMNLTITPRINTANNQQKEVAFGCPPRWLAASRIAEEEGVNPSKLRASLKKIAESCSSKSKIKSGTLPKDTKSTKAVR